jgi:hypothetical protein
MPLHDLMSRDDRGSEEKLYSKSGSTISHYAKSFRCCPSLVLRRCVYRTMTIGNTPRGVGCDAIVRSRGRRASFGVMLRCGVVLHDESIARGKHNKFQRGLSVISLFYIYTQVANPSNCLVHPSSRLHSHHHFLGEKIFEKLRRFYLRDFDIGKNRGHGLDTLRDGILDFGSFVWREKVLQKWRRLYLGDLGGHGFDAIRGDIYSCALHPLYQCLP